MNKRIFLIIGFIFSIFIYGGFITTIFQKTYLFQKNNNYDKKQILYSENAFYYSFYEQLSKTSNLSEEIRKITSDDRVQYPEKINVLKRYNIWPEVFLSVLYRISGETLNVDLFDYYIGGVIIFSALGIGILYLLSYELTGSILGGVMSVFFVIMSFPWSTRLISYPALRENFGIPTLILQVYLLVRYFKYTKMKNLLLVVGATIFHLLFWQFSTYTLLIESVAIFILLLNVDKRDRKSLVQLMLLIILMIFFKTMISGAEGNNHVLDYLKFQLFKSVPNFHIMMYHCNGGFGIINNKILEALYENLLIIMMIIGCLGIKFISGKNGKIFRFIVTLSLGYFFFSMIASRFVVLAIPFLTLSAVMPFSLVYWNCILGRNNNELKLFARGGLLMFVLVSWFLIKTNVTVNYLKNGINNNYYSLSIEPYKWINENTDKNSVFGASMTLTSKILLITGRKISNNPFYENANNRQKTYEIYRMYGRESEAGMYDIALKNGLNYLIIEKNICYQKSITGCSSSDLYITEDKDKTLSPLCWTLGGKGSENFETVFEDNNYRIIKVIRNL